MIHSIDYRNRFSIRYLLALALLGAGLTGIANTAARGQVAPPAATRPATGPATAPAVLPATAPAVVVAPPATAPVRVVRGTALSDPIKRGAAPPVALISSFIKAEAALLNRPELKPPPRNTLITGAGTDTGDPASDKYQQAYADELNKALLPQFKSPDPRVRLSAAIVTARAAARLTDGAAAIALAPCATAAVADKSEAVAIWGVKAATSIIPRQLDVKTVDPKLAQAMIAAVQAFPASGPIAEDAYDALAGPALTAAGVPPGRKTAALPYLLALLNARAGMYQKVDTTLLDPAAPAVPGAPLAESPAMLFLSTKIWSKQLPAAQKQQIATPMIDLTRELARIAPVLTPRGASEPPEAVRKDELIEILRRTGSAASVVLDREGRSDLKKAAEQVFQITPGTPDETLKERVTALEEAFKTAGLIAAGAPATQPVAGP